MQICFYSPVCADGKSPFGEIARKTSRECIRNLPSNLSPPSSVHLSSRRISIPTSNRVLRCKERKRKRKRENVIYYRERERSVGKRNYFHPARCCSMRVITRSIGSSFKEMVSERYIMQPSERTALKYSARPQRERKTVALARLVPESSHRVFPPARAE